MGAGGNHTGRDSSAMLSPHSSANGRLHAMGPHPHSHAVAAGGIASGAPPDVMDQTQHHQ